MARHWHKNYGSSNRPVQNDLLVWPELFSLSLKVKVLPGDVSNGHHGFDPDRQVGLVEAEDVVERDGNLVTGGLVEEGRR